MDRSPYHSRNLSLILNTETVLVSPQFYVTMDDQFSTVKNDNKGQSMWKVRCGFVRQRGHVREIEEEKSKGMNELDIIPSNVDNQQVGGQTLEHTISKTSHLELTDDERMIPMGWRSQKENITVDRLTYSHCVEVN